MPGDKIIKVELDDYMLYDQLHDLAKEYAISIDQLTSIAIRRLLDDIRFAWDLRKGITPAHRQDGQT